MSPSVDPGDHPRRAPSVNVLDRSGSAKLVDQAGDQVLGLNETALAIWDLCDGQTSIDEMVEAITAAFPVDESEARTDVEHVIETFASFAVLASAGH